MFLDLYLFHVLVDLLYLIVGYSVASCTAMGSVRFSLYSYRNNTTL